MKKISIAVLGSTGYVGLELVYLLSLREDISINFLGSENSANKKINFIDSRIKKNLPKIKLNSQFKEKDIKILFSLQFSIIVFASFHFFILIKGLLG